MDNAIKIIYECIFNDETECNDFYLKIVHDMIHFRDWWGFDKQIFYNDKLKFKNIITLNIIVRHSDQTKFDHRNKLIKDFLKYNKINYKEHIDVTK